MFMYIHGGLYTLLLSTIYMYMLFQLPGFACKSINFTLETFKEIATVDYNSCENLL